MSEKKTTGSENTKRHPNKDERVGLRSEYEVEAYLELQIQKKQKELEGLQKEYEDSQRELEHNTKSLEELLSSRTWKLITFARNTITLPRRVKNKALRIVSRSARSKAKASEDPLKLLYESRPKNVRSLKKEYFAQGLDRVKNTFVLYRVVGNDLYPRHKKGQSRENLKFILENEPELENCEKLFIVNRIIDQDEEKAVIELLKQHKKKYVHIPFKLEEYKKVGLDLDCLPDDGYLFGKEFTSLRQELQGWIITATYRLKNNYIMNNNGARNAALRDGKKRAKWVLPWDGNCFVTKEAWEKIKTDVTSSPHLKYFVVPMSRIMDNDDLLHDPENIPRPVEEPQIIFRSDSEEEFNEEFCYGRRPKVEMFWRLRVPGPWSAWIDEKWDQKRRPVSKEAGQFGVAGWVARMFSGMKTLEQNDIRSIKLRGFARNDAILSTIRKIDAEIAGFSSEVLASYDGSVLDKEVKEYKAGKKGKLSKVVASLLNEADTALDRAPYSVVDKTNIPPSGDKQDYWHPAPYWWPNPDTPDGLPYIRKDGERAPGTSMYEPDSDKYDRTRIQYVFDDSITLALAWKFTSNKKYAEHAVNILDRFFVNPETRMNPHLRYAQVRMGHNSNEGDNSGIIEMKDLYYYLDAARLLSSSGLLPKRVLEEFKNWLSEYLSWLLESQQGRRERLTNNNHGTYYDLQVASIAAFLNNHSVLYDTLMQSQCRIACQFAKDGSQPEELARKTTQHYCTFNLQGWLNLSELASRAGIDLWVHQTSHGVTLGRGAKWLLAHAGKEWPYKQIEEFDPERFAPICFGVPQEFVDKKVAAHFPVSKYDVKSRFHPHDGVKPYWNIGL